MCALVHGLEGIRHADYKVYIAGKSTKGGLDPDFAEISGNIKNIINNNSEFSVDLVRGIDRIILECEPIGEFRRDSIEITGEEGNTIESNEIGEISLSKQCSFTAELVNTTADNINILEEMSQSGAVFVLEEMASNAGKIQDKDYSAYEYQDMRRYIIIANLASAGDGDVRSKFSVSDKNTGGDVPRATIKVAMNTGKVSNFRLLRDVIRDCVDIGNFSYSEYNGRDYGFNFSGSPDKLTFAYGLGNIDISKLIEGDISEHVELDLSGSSLKKEFCTISATSGGGGLSIVISLDSGYEINDGEVIKFRLTGGATDSGLNSMWLPAKVTNR